MSTPWTKYAAQPTPAVSGGPWEKYAAPAEQEPTDPSGRTPTGEPAPDDARNGFQRMLDNMTTPDPRREEWQSPARSGFDDFAQHVASSVLPLISHPIESAKSIGKVFADAPDVPGGTVMEMARPMLGKAVQDYQAHGPIRGTTDALGTGAGMWASGELGGSGLRLAGDAWSAIRDAAIGNPDVAALKALRVGPASSKSLSTLNSVEGARPFMQGVKDLADAQARVPAAKAEIWSPYQQAIDKIGGKQVMGPDGPTTVGDLENERLQISANLRTLKSGTPEGIQLAAQKGMNQADLLAREKAVQSALDPHLAQAGIDPKLIRQTFGQVAQVGGRLAGKSTLAEPEQPYGFGRMMNMSLAEPRSWFGEPAKGVRDLAAGRPLWSGKPTDINLREAFRGGGPKPDFRSPMSAMPRFEQPPKQLEANLPGNAGYGDIDVGGMAGISHPGPQVTPLPKAHLQLPESAGPGMRYVKPYVEPPEPSTIRPMPPEKLRALPAQASPGETQPYIAHRIVPSGAAGEKTRLQPPTFMRPSEPMPMARTVSPSGEVRTNPRGLLPEKTFPDNNPPPPTSAPVFPAGSEYRDIQETPYYPAASAFRVKGNGGKFDFDSHIGKLMQDLRKKEQ